MDEPKTRRTGRSHAADRAAFSGSTPAWSQSCRPHSAASLARLGTSKIRTECRRFWGGWQCLPRRTNIARRVRIGRCHFVCPTVIGWRERYAASGLAGLEDEARSGRPRTVDHRQIVAATLTPPPRKYAVTHWSSRLLAGHLGIGDATVARAWREYGVQPWRAESFRFSTDPALVAKVTDVVGLYLAPPENAAVLCVDEKSQIQALDHTAPILPLQPGLAERRSHDYVRHGTTTLFAALEIATGQVTAARRLRHRTPSAPHSSNRSPPPTPRWSCT
jgi:Homeodomain-like domain